MKEFKVENHCSSLVPEGFEWELVWSDEFDGTELDRTKWDYRLYIWGQRHRTFTDEGLYLDGNSNAVFTVIEKDGEICSQHLQTGYNWIDTPREDSDLRFLAVLSGHWESLRNINFCTSTDIMNADASCRKSRAGGLHSGFSHR